MFHSTILRKKMGNGSTSNTKTQKQSKTISASRIHSDAKQWKHVKHRNFVLISRQHRLNPKFIVHCLRVDPNHFFFFSPGFYFSFFLLLHTTRTVTRKKHQFTFNGDALVIRVPLTDLQMIVGLNKGIWFEAVIGNKWRRFFVLIFFLMLGTRWMEAWLHSQHIMINDTVKIVVIPRRCSGSILA